jgi:hypothetical protein
MTYAFVPGAVRLFCAMVHAGGEHAALKVAKTILDRCETIREARLGDDIAGPEWGARLHQTALGVLMDENQQDMVLAILRTIREDMAFRCAPGAPGGVTWAVVTPNRI